MLFAEPTILLPCRGLTHIARHGRMKGIVDNLLVTTHVIQIFNDLFSTNERLIDISLMSSDNPTVARRRFPSYPQTFPHLWINRSRSKMAPFSPTAASARRTWG